MRRTWILLAPLLLAGCIKDSATHYINGNEHTLTLRAAQEYFWNEQVDLTLVAARWPDCQRQFKLGKVPASALEVELFAAGDNVYSLRAGAQRWQIETQKCTMLGTPDDAALGQPLGTFRMGEKKMVFEAKSA